MIALDARHRHFEIAQRVGRKIHHQHVRLGEQGMRIESDFNAG
jgi:hypothetical protein